MDPRSLDNPQRGGTAGIQFDHHLDRLARWECFLANKAWHSP